MAPVIRRSRLGRFRWSTRALGPTVIALPGILAGCTDATGGGGAIGEGAPFAYMYLTPTDTMIPETASFQLRVRMTDSVGNTKINDSLNAALTSQSYTYGSLHSGIATVSSSGRVTGVAAGSASIVARYGNLSETTTVMVLDPGVARRTLLTGMPFGLAVTGSRAFVTQSQAANVSILGATSGAVVGVFGTGRNPSAVSTQPGGSQVVVANQGTPTLTLADGASGAVIRTVQLPRTPAAALISGDGATIWATTSTVTTGVLYALQSSTGQVLDSVAVPYYAAAFVHHPTLPRLYAAGSLYGQDPALLELDAVTLDTLRSWPVTGQPSSATISPDGAWLYLANLDGWVDKVDLTGGTGFTSTLLTSGNSGVALSPNGATVALSLDNGTDVRLNSGTMALLSTVVVSGRPRGLAFSDVSGFLLVANVAGWVDYLR